MKKQPKPWRYKLVEKRLTFWQSLHILWRDWEWKTTRQDFQVVSLDSPEWDEAPFESATLYVRNVFSMEVPNASILYKRP